MVHALVVQMHRWNRQKDDNELKGCPSFILLISISWYELDPFLFPSPPLLSLPGHVRRPPSQHCVTVRQGADRNRTARYAWHYWWHTTYGPHQLMWCPPCQQTQQPVGGVTSRFWLYCAARARQRAPTRRGTASTVSTWCRQGHTISVCCQLVHVFNWTVSLHAIHMHLCCTRYASQNISLLSSFYHSILYKIHWYKMNELNSNVLV